VYCAIVWQNQQRELTMRHAKETEKEMQKRLDVQKAEYEEAIKRHISFIDQVRSSSDRIIYEYWLWLGYAEGRPKIGSDSV